MPSNGDNRSSKKEDAIVFGHLSDGTKRYNYQAVLYNLSARLATSGQGNYHLESPAPIPTPFESPATYTLADWNKQLIPRLGQAGHIAALRSFQINGQGVEQTPENQQLIRTAHMSAETFSTAAVNSDEGWKCRMSTTNDQSAILEADKQYKRAQEKREENLKEAKGHVLKCVTPEFASQHFQAGWDAKQCFDVLLEKHVAWLNEESESLGTHWINMRPKANENPEKFTERILNLAMDFALMGETKTELDKLRRLYTPYTKAVDLGIKSLANSIKAQSTNIAVSGMTLEKAMTMLKGVVPDGKPVVFEETDTASAFFGSASSGTVQGQAKRCFKCQGFGHLAKVCPTEQSMTLNGIPNVSGSGTQQKSNNPAGKGKGAGSK
jgi:hypothetical protein